jgi:thiosulfate dehydrogenase
MAKTAYAASYIHDNMPFGIDYTSPVLTVQQAWDVAVYVTAQPRPPAPPEPTSSLR